MVPRKRWTSHKSYVTVRLQRHFGHCLMEPGEYQDASDTTASVLPTSGCTAGSFPAVCGVCAQINRTCWNCDLQGGEIVTSSKLQRLLSWKTGIRVQRNLRATTQGLAERMFSKHTTPDRSFATDLQSAGGQHQQEPSEQKEQQSSGNIKHQDINQIWGQSVQTKNVNVNNVIFQNPVALCLWLRGSCSG
jgi:hypothetical protein